MESGCWDHVMEDLFLSLLSSPACTRNPASQADKVRYSLFSVHLLFMCRWLGWLLHPGALVVGGGLVPSSPSSTEQPFGR